MYHLFAHRLWQISNCCDNEWADIEKCILYMYMYAWMSAKCNCKMVMMAQRLCLCVCVFICAVCWMVSWWMKKNHILLITEILPQKWLSVSCSLYDVPSNEPNFCVVVCFTSMPKFGNLSWLDYTLAGQDRPSPVWHVGLDHTIYYCWYDK